MNKESSQKKAQKIISDFDFQFFGTTSVGERGQIVIPAKARQFLELKKGEKLLAFSKGQFFIGFMKVADMSAVFKQMYMKFTEARIGKKKNK